VISATMVGPTSYLVTVAKSEDHEFKVELEPEFYRELCAGGVTHEWVLVQAFRFLLERESVEEILPQFNLRQIGDYFPEFVEQMQSQLIESR